jgi:hypothetical protein
MRNGIDGHFPLAILWSEPVLDFLSNLLTRGIFAKPHSPALASSREEISLRIAAVDWASYETAYGPAIHTSKHLELLLVGTEKQAMVATHSLWSGLCHQHAYLSSAAEPALPFLLMALRASNDRLKVEILDIFLGFAICQHPPEPFVTRIREQVASERPLFEDLRDSPDESVREFAGWVCGALDGRMPGDQA